MLQPSATYVIIPCTFNPQEEGKFSISFQCSGTLKIAPLPPNKEWKWVTGKVNYLLSLFFIIYIVFNSLF